VHAPNLGHRVGAADHRAQLAAGRAREEVGISQKPTTARLLRISAPLWTLFGSRLAIP
jgi:hypothetical protein